jgi:hypothetical protein
MSSISIVCLLALATVPLTVATTSRQNESCPGCIDGSVDPTISGADWGSSMAVGAVVTTSDGACFLIDELGCVMSYPCTPFLTIGAMAGAPNGWIDWRGQIGSVGLGSHGGAVPQSPVVLYGDYTGVDCGANIGYSFLLEAKIAATSLGTKQINGTFTCSACDD